MQAKNQLFEEKNCTKNQLLIIEKPNVILTFLAFQCVLAPIAPVSFFNPARLKKIEAKAGIAPE